MRFAATHKFVSYLMVATAFAVLALSGELPPELTLLTTVGLVVSFFFDPQRRPWMNHRLYRYGWNAAVLGVFAYSFNAWLQGESLLGTGTRFLCCLLLAKVWSRHANRDYLHAYIISFFMLVAGSILNNNLIYGVCFVLYVIFTTWTLSLFHLRREMEENYLLKHLPGRDGKAAESERVEVDRILNSRRVVGRSFLLGTSLISLVIFLVSGVVFFLTPRIGLGLDIGLQRHGIVTAGFSDHIQLGGHGRIRDNPQVVARVEVRSGRPEGTLYLRGVTFDQYEGGHWTRSRRVPAQSFNRYGSYYFLGLGRAPLNQGRIGQLLGNALRTEINLEPMDTPVLFVPSKLLAVALPETLLPGGPRLSAGPGGEIYSSDRKTGMRYTAYSEVKPPGYNALAGSPDLPADHDDDLDAYLELPPRLPERVRKLAVQVAGQARGPHARAMAILTYLQRNYAYTTQLNRDERYEPLEDFLFIEKRGHCEYFASAMAILLRAVGVPSRSVNGYLGGEWNDYGNYLVVRQQNAHSWVEAYLTGVGWVTYDPTPPSAMVVPDTGLWARLRQVTDTMELSWFKYVVEYDLRTQVQMAEGARRWLYRGREQQGFGVRRRLGAAWEAVKVHGKAVAAVLMALGALGYVLFQVRRRVVLPGMPRRRRENALLAQALGALARRGYSQRAGETLRGLAERVGGAGDPAGPPFAELVRRYYAVRFGQEPLDLAELRALARDVVRATNRGGSAKAPPPSPGKAG